jgi:hypothetical protein
MAHQALARVDLSGLDGRLLEAAAVLDPAIIRALDAIHLAAALSLGSDLDVVVSYDARLLDGARILGLPTLAQGQIGSRLGSLSRADAPSMQGAYVRANRPVVPDSCGPFDPGTRTTSGRGRTGPSGSREVETSCDVTRLSPVMRTMWLARRTT